MATDEELLAGWAEGNATAGNELVKRHFAMVYGFFRSKLGGDIEDLIQRTFLATAEAQSRFRGDSTFRAFVFGVARNVLLAHLRAVYKDRKVDPYSTSAESLAESPGDLLAHRREQRLLLEGLRRLPLDDQIALELRYWEQLSSADIGAVLGLTAASARSRLKRARVQLEGLLAELAAGSSHLKSTTDDLDRWASSLRDVAGPRRGSGDSG